MQAGQGVDVEVNRQLLHLGQVLGMSFEAEPSYISCPMCLVLMHQPTGLEVQSGHAHDCLPESLFYLGRGQDVLDEGVLLTVVA